MFTYLHLHTPFLPFFPSLISLVVSVDVKHHVYLLQDNARAGCPGHSPPLTHHVSVHTMDLYIYVYMCLYICTGPWYIQHSTVHVPDDRQFSPHTAYDFVFNTQIHDWGRGVGVGKRMRGGGVGGGRFTMTITAWPLVISNADTKWRNTKHL